MLIPCIIRPGFVAEMKGLDATRCMAHENEWAALQQACNDQSVVILRDQRLSDDELLSLAARFGVVYKSRGVPTREKNSPPGIAEISNIDREGKLLPSDHATQRFSEGNRLWHSDLSFTDDGAAQSLLLAVEVPERGGETEFSDMCKAYETLSHEAKRQIESLFAHHSIRYSREKTGYAWDDKNGPSPEAIHPLVYRHQPSGMCSLYLGAHAGRILEMDSPASDRLIDELITHAARAEFRYVHAWRTGDLVIWDNRRVLHRRGANFDPLRRRALKRVTVVGDLADAPIDAKQVREKAHA